MRFSQNDRKYLLAGLATVLVLAVGASAGAIDVTFQLTHGNDGSGLPCASHKMQIQSHPTACHGDTRTFTDNSNVTMRAMSIASGTIYGPYFTRRFPAHCDAGTGPGTGNPCTFTYQYAALNVNLFNDGTDLDDVGTKKYRVQLQSQGTYADDAVLNVPHSVSVTFRLYTQKSGTIYGPYMTRTFNAGKVQPDEQSDDPGNPNCPDGNTNGVPDAAETAANHSCDDDGDTLWDLEYATLNTHLFNGGTELNDDVPVAGIKYRVQIQSYGSAANGGAVHLPPHGNVNFRLYTTKSGTIYGPYMTRVFWKGDVQRDEQKHAPTPATWQTAANRLEDDDPDNQWDLEYATLNVHLFNSGTDLNDGQTASGPVAGVKYRVEIQSYGSAANGGAVHLPPHGNVNFRLYTTKSGTIYGPWMTRVYWKGDVQRDEQGTGPNTPESSTAANHTGDDDSDGQWDLEYATVKYRFKNMGTCGGCTTQIQSYGSVPHNNKAHFPPHANVTKRADTCAGLSGWKTAQYNKGDGTWTWEQIGSYSQP